ncbi:MAG TPA: polysaccharide deacetylase family protein [Bryobacteraceae bacterium]|nr:polysaccharide deacetylase family protein [Bryobacteraceae bacterium]
MPRHRSVILTYHSLDTTRSTTSLAPELFRRQMEALSERRTPVVPLSSVAQTSGSVALTFDDGYLNFFDVALPLLVQHRFPATVFVVTGYCGLHNGWESSQRHPPRHELMGWPQLRELVRLGITLGAHTVNHPHLPRLSPEEIARELRDSRMTLENSIGQAVDSFAYPYGAWNAAARLAVSREFRLACGTELGFVDSRSDPFLLPRIDVLYRPQPWWFRRLTGAVSQAYLAAQRWKKEMV